MSILVIDTRLIFYQAYHINKPITYGLNVIEKVLQKYNVYPKKIIFAWDSKYGSKKRKELYPKYKAHRKELIKTESEKKKLKKFNEDYDKMENICNDLGNVIHIDGYEADDIANIIVDRFKDTHKIYLLSSDSDWASNLLTDNVKQIHLVRGMITRQSVKQEYELFAEQIIPAQALKGIEKENVEGIYKLGKKRLYKLFNEGKSITEIIKILQDYIDNNRYGMKLPENFDNVEEMYDFNLKILDRISFNELTQTEQEIFKQQFNRKKAIIPTREVENKILLELYQSYIFSDFEKKIYKLT